MDVMDISGHGSVGGTSVRQNAHELTASCVQRSCLSLRTMSDCQLFWRASLYNGAIAGIFQGGAKNISQEAKRDKMPGPLAKYIGI